MNKILEHINLVFRTSAFGHQSDRWFNRVGIYYPQRRLSGYSFEPVWEIDEFTVFNG